MKNFKLLIIAVLILCGNVFAAPLSIVVPYPPGGSADLEAQQVKLSLSRVGASSEITYLKSCAQAINEIKNNGENSILVMGSTEYNTDGVGECPIKETDPLRIVAGVSRIPFYLCNSPNKHYTLHEKTDVPITVGVVKSIQNFASNIIRHIDTQNRVKLVTYRGGGEIIKAAVAGDIDMWFSSGAINNFPNADCIGSTVRNDVRGYPFIANKFNIKTMDEIYYSTILLVNNQAMATSVIDKIIAVQHDDQLKKYLIDNHKMTVSNTELLGDINRFRYIK